MADPLSITASVITLITVSVQVTALLKKYRDEVSGVDERLTGLFNDVSGFQQVLESMKETFDHNDVKGHQQDTGHAGSHWKNLSRSLEDGTGTLKQLHELLESINKKTSVLDGPRKHLRYKNAIDQIVTYREQIQSYRAALQLSLSTIILWNQVTLQKSTEDLPSKIVPTLDSLYDEFRSFGTLLNAKIEALQISVSKTQGQDSDHELKKMSNLRECVRSAADVVSTASTTLTAEVSDAVSIGRGSDMGDIFIKEENEPMLRWISSHTVYEFEDSEVSQSTFSQSTGADEAETEYQSDSDSDIESEMIRALFNDAKRRKENGDLKGAARHFTNCLTRISATSSHISLTSIQSVAASGVTKDEILTLLVDTYCLMEFWNKATTTMAEKLSITEHQVGKKDEKYYGDTLRLGTIMFKNKEYVQSHLQARRALRGFRKLGESGFKGYEECLNLLVDICTKQGNTEEEDAYSALLASHLEKTGQLKPKTRSRPVSLKSPATPKRIEQETKPTHLDTATSEPMTPSSTTHDSSATEKHTEAAESGNTSKDEAKAESSTQGNSSTVSLGRVISLAAQNTKDIPRAPESPNKKQKGLQIYELYDQRTIEMGRDLTDIELLSLRALRRYFRYLYGHAPQMKANEVLGMWRCDITISFVLVGRFMAWREDYIEHSNADGGSKYLATFLALQRACKKYYTDTPIDQSDSELEKRDPYSDKIVSSPSLDMSTTIFPSNIPDILEIPLVHAQQAKTSARSQRRLREASQNGARSSCPICQKSLSWLSEEAASMHTNECIDQPPTTKPRGTWSCNRISCRTYPVQLLSEEDCIYCLQPRNIRSPSTLNNFMRDSSLRYKEPLVFRDFSEDRGADLKAIKITLLGDAGCGKATLTKQFNQRLWHDAYETVQLPYCKQTVRYEVAISQAFLAADKDFYEVILLCFDIANPESAQNLSKWYYTARKQQPSTPIIVVGCKKDLRSDKATVEKLIKLKSMVTSPYLGVGLAAALCAKAYFETSESSPMDTLELLRYAAAVAIEPPPFQVFDVSTSPASLLSSWIPDTRQIRRDRPLDTKRGFLRRLMS